MLREQTVINECYILQDRLGEDSFTEHWSATAIFSAKKFLLRFLRDDVDGELADRVREAAFRSYRAQGSAIADIVEFEEWRGRGFISSEFHDDVSLFDRSRSSKGLTIEDVCAILLSLARGLSVFHAQGIAYGNLNPEQVLVGTASHLSQSVRIRKPSMFALLGTIPNGDERVTVNFAYASRACKNGAEPTEADDVFSLGVHLVALLVGRVPFPDDEARVRADGPSLPFAANALLRRGVGTELVRVALRALVEDSAERYRSCAEFVADVRAFMDANKINTGMMEDYFRKQSPGPGADLSAEYPVVPLDPVSVERIERAELLATRDSAVRSVDDYIRDGLRTIEADGSEAYFAVHAHGKRPSASEALSVSATIQPSAPNIPPAPCDVRAPSLPPPNPAITVASRDASAPATPAVPVAPATPAKSPPRATPRPVGTTTTATAKIPRKKKTEKKSADADRETVRVSWNYHRVLYDDVVKIVDISVNRAKKGTGSFRFIQEPTDPALASRLFHGMERLSERSTYVNAGSFDHYGTADIKDFLAMTRVALARALSPLPPAALRSLAGKVRPLDSYGAFAAAPTGAILYGKNGPDVGETVLDTVACQKSVIRALCAFGKKDRPLVIACRHGESMTRELDLFLNRMALGVSSCPACVIVFFSGGEFESWHSLTSIRRAKFENGEAIRDS